MARRYRVSFVLPAHNEEANIATAIERTRAVARRLTSSYEIIIVDDGSTDSTGTIVRAIAETDRKIRLVVHEKNRGYGEALRSGFRESRMDLVFFTDADLQFDLEELAAFLPWIDRVHVVAGYRIDRKDKKARILAARAWNLIVRVMFYVPVRDIDCAFKLFRRSVFAELDLESVGAMVNTELMVRIARAGYSVVELGVTHYPRTAGKPRGASPRVIWTAFRELLKMRHRLRALGAGVAARDQIPPAEIEPDGAEVSRAGSA
ncbi:MAG: glycosyltransferase family 2 protein [Actinomycetota bacterium]